MSAESFLAGLVEGECVDPNADAQILAEFSCQSEDVCCELRDALLSLPCQVEWQGGRSAFILYVLGNPGADQDQLLAAVAGFLDRRPNLLRLIETRLVQSKTTAQARHGFRFVSRNPRGPQDIVLAAGSHAFGSGNHPSTSLVVELLEELDDIPSPVLDVGCGTGVLSIIAGRLGARQVVGIDIDKEAVTVAAENAGANDLSDRLSFSTTALADLQGPFSLIIANLTASVLYRLVDSISAQSASGARLVISGLQGRQGDEAEEWFVCQGWCLEKRRHLGKWQARVLRRSSPC